MIKVLKSGFYTTIQDSGRFGYQEYGVPHAGVMDDYAFKLANSILDNNTDDAVLEITMTGPTLEFTVDSVICITGADMSPKLNDITIKLNHSILLKAGDVVSFGKLNYGFRAYIAVKGGLLSELIMNSRSFYKNITKSAVVLKNDLLLVKKQQSQIKIANASIKINTNHFISNTLEVFKGPEFEQLEAKEQEFLLATQFTISKNHSRMAYQLEEVVENQLSAIITSFVLPGTVQLTPSGKLIVLMKDCQTTGGYPRVLQLSEHSMNLLSQKQTNNFVHFRLTAQ